MHPILRGFQHRNFRLFFIGQTLSMTGTWMQHIAISWLMYRLTGSAFMLGLTGFALQIPMLLVSPFAGVWVDRFNRRRLLLLTQTLALAPAVLLAALTSSGRIEAWHIIALSLFLGSVNAFDQPSRGAFLLEMVETKEHLPNAIALNSMIMHSARFVGPSIAGVVLAFAGEAVCFMLNALSYLALIVAATSTNTILQSIADEDKRGRVVSIYSMCFVGMAPVGNFIAGSIASHIGAPAALLLNGLCCTLAALAFALRIGSWRAAIRPVYQRLGLVK